MSKNKETDVVMTFPSRTAAREFMQWMDGQGEQEHYEWTRLREKQSLGFEYDHRALTIKAKWETT